MVGLQIPTVLSNQPIPKNIQIPGHYVRGKVAQIIL